MANLPTGTVTFLFTDLEGSTQLWERHPEGMKSAVARHENISRRAIEGNRGYVVKLMGDGVMASFGNALDALFAAVAIQRAMLAESWDEVPPLRVRAGIHSGSVEERAGDYYGSAVNRTARVMGVGHGGQILLSETAHDLVRDAALGDLAFRDLGQHRLRDLSRPERIFQVAAPDLPADFPPLKTLDVLPNNLPNLLTTFVGREREKDQVKQVLNAARLLTLTGAGGTGKTRLSIEVGFDVLSDFPDGVWLAEFAAVTDPNLIAQTIATTLHLREERGRPIAAALQDYLSNKQALIILDNCEHLIEPIARIADALLRNCARLKILASSREPLGIPGEKTLRVPSLAVPQRDQLPPIEQLTQYEAIRLFIDRAANLQPSFMLTPQNAASVAQIVRRLDGIPLAIELGAARIKSLSVDKIAARLDDQFNLLSMGSRTLLPRQQTLNALIEWSFNLLTEPEKTLFRRLSVLVGGWSLEAAEAICSGNGLERHQILNALSQLVEKSLVNAQEDDAAETRYVSLETIRQYARLKLLELGEENTLRERHCEWFLKLAEEIEPCLRGSDQAQCLNRLEKENDNLNSALDWVMQTQDADRALRFAGALYDYWNVRGYWSEGRDRINKALALTDATNTSHARAKALNAAGSFALRQNDYAVAETCFTASLEIAQGLGDHHEIGRALHGLGAKYESQGDYSRARDYYMQSLQIFGTLGSKVGKAGTLLNLGAMDLNHREYAQAQAYLEECLPIFRELGDQRSIGQVVGNLGIIAYFRGDYALARSFCEESLALARELKDKHRIANQLNNLGHIAIRLGEHAKAKTFFAESLPLFAVLKSKRMLVDVFSGMANVAIAMQNAREAARLLGAAQALVDAIGVPITDANRAEFENSIAAARALDENGFQTAWQEGMAMPLDQVITAALGEPRGR